MTNITVEPMEKTSRHVLYHFLLHFPVHLASGVGLRCGLTAASVTTRQCHYGNCASTTAVAATATSLATDNAAAV